MEDRHIWRFRLAVRTAGMQTEYPITATLPEAYERELLEILDGQATE